MASIPSLIARGAVLAPAFSTAGLLRAAEAFDPVAATEAYIARQPAEARAQRDAYFEGGYWLLNHVYERTVYLSLMFAGVYWFVHIFAGIVLRRRGAAWGITGPADLAAMPVLFAGFAIAMFLTTPVRNSITRVSETEADLYGLNAAREPDAMAEVFLMLSEYRKLKPGPIEEILFFSHPSGYNRILSAMRWKAEHLPAVATAPAGDSD